MVAGLAAVEVRRVRVCPLCRGGSLRKMAGCPRCGGCGLVQPDGTMLPAMVAATSEEAWNEHDSDLDNTPGR